MTKLTKAQVDFLRTMEKRTKYDGGWVYPDRVRGIQSYLLNRTIAVLRRVGAIELRTYGGF